MFFLGTSNFCRIDRRRFSCSQSTGDFTEVFQKVRSCCSLLFKQFFVKEPAKNKETKHLTFSVNRKDLDKHLDGDEAAVFGGLLFSF